MSTGAWLNAESSMLKAAVHEWPTMTNPQGDIPQGLSYTPCPRAGLINWCVNDGTYS